MQETMEHSALDDDVVPNRAGLSDQFHELAEDDPSCDDVGDGGQRDDESDLDRRGHEGGRWCADAGRPTRFKPSSPSPTDAVRDGSAKLGHPVQNVTREHGLTPLPR